MRVRCECGTKLNLKTRNTQEQIIQLQTHISRRDRRRAVPPVSHHPAHLLQVASKFDGLEVSDAKRLRLMEADNRKLKKRVADQSFDLMGLKGLLAKKF